MLNLLVVDDNLYFDKLLINNIAKSFANDFNLCIIATDGKEALLEIESNSFDIILLDLKLPKFNGVEILEELNLNYKNQYNNSVLVISGESDLLYKIVHNPCVFSYINKIDGIDSILKELYNLIQIQKEEKYRNGLRNSIIQELQKINYNVAYNGTMYICDTINTIIKNDKIHKYKLKRDIIPILTEKYNTTYSNIKMNIMNSTENMFFECKQEILNKYFGYTVIEKPSLKIVIDTVIDKLYKQGSI